MDELSVLRLQAPSDLSGGALGQAVSALLPCSVGVDFTSSTAGFRVSATDCALFVIDAPQVPADYFSGDELESAERAAEGDIDACLALPERWTGTIDVDLAIPLRQAKPAVYWRAVRSTDVVAGAIERLPWWQLANVLRDPEGGGRHVRYVVVEEPAVHFVAAAFSVVALGRCPDPSPLDRAARPDFTLPRPEQLWPLDRPVEAFAIDAVLSSRAAACAWAYLADAWSALDSTGELEFFGFRRVYATIPANGITEPTAQVTTGDLYKWATEEAAFDRLLAIRQVCSLYPDGGFIERAGDVQRAAEPIYAGLRREAVAEVFAAHRDARSLALGTARQSAEAALTAAKSVAERALASLAGIAGVVIARAASTPIDEKLADRLLLSIAGFALFLAVWAVIIEGRTMVAALDSLESDVREVGDILTPAQQRAVSELSLVKLAKRRIQVLRFTAPVAYLAVAVIAVIAR
ncbi:MAG TPA: hypothetical protein VK988_23060 [Acidimicrobiales bacterium]|nr:hypothetical protein [Acidimicrobiales bacterium]